jgi:hypothetical protein
MPGEPRRRPLFVLAALGALIVMIPAGAYIYRESGAWAATGGLVHQNGSGSGGLVHQNGSGPGGETTEVFTVDGDWDLRWSYDCSSSLGSQNPKLDQCDFFLTVKQYSDCEVSQQNPGITRRGAADHGVAHYHSGGTFYFVVEADGSWTFTVTGSGSASGRGPAPHCTNDG